MTDKGRSLLASTRRIGRTLGLVLALAVSLLTFPSGVVVMTACWLIACTVAGLRYERATTLLIAPVLVILVKRVDWPVGLWVFMVVAAAAIAISVSVRRFRDKPHRYLLLAALWLAWLGFAVDARRAVQVNHVVQALDRRPIVCIGDSLTSYARSGGYPEVLGEMVDVPVINLGQPGVTSAEALKKLPDLVAAHPQVVVIELGGHDFLKDPSFFKSASRASTKGNLERLIEAARQSGAEVVLIEVPRGFVVDVYAGLERQIAREQDVAIIADTVIRRFVLSSPVAPPGMWLGGPYLSDDGLHPNHRGNLLLAHTVLDSLERLYGPAIRHVRHKAGHAR